MIDTYKFCDSIMKIFFLQYYVTSINSICGMNDIDIDIDIDIEVVQLLLPLLLPPLCIPSQNASITNASL